MKIVIVLIIFKIFHNTVVVNLAEKGGLQN